MMVLHPPAPAHSLGLMGGILTVGYRAADFLICSYTLC